VVCAEMTSGIKGSRSFLHHLLWQICQSSIMFIVIGTQSREINDGIWKERRAEMNPGIQIEEKCTR
jgi:hypothetical protein